jgi:crotonobetainyl-CoA:carnitine CoA-transferase CaiB-like acyl-CoA transferase
MPQHADQEEALFAGLKVLDVGTWIAGPVAGTILADFGADVIKVEIPGAGDPFRALANGPLSPRAEMNYMWECDGRNKRSIALNLASAEGREILMRLVRQCDVFITNQPFPTRRKLRLNYEDLAPENERMVYASLTAYGETGPDAEQEGFDHTAWWARSGLMDRVRSPGALPGNSVPGMGDHPTAVALYAAIVTALMRRERTGRGGKVHTSLLANGVWANGCLAQGAVVGAEFAVREVPPPPARFPNRVLYQTSDGRFFGFFMVRTHEDFDAVLIAIGRDDLPVDPRFADPEARAENGLELVESLRATFAAKPMAHWRALFREHGIPATVVAEMEDLPNDPQLRANNMVIEPAGPGVASPLIINHPLNVDGLPRAGARHAPEVGENTAEVLAELGFTAEQIADFAASGVTTLK